jgi:hypothetical protein
MINKAPSQELCAGRYSDEYVRWRIDQSKKEILESLNGIEFEHRDLEANAGYVLAPDGKELPSYCFARECSYLALIEILKAEYDIAAAIVVKMREAMKA